MCFTRRRPESPCHSPLQEETHFSPRPTGVRVRGHWGTGTRPKPSSPQGRNSVEVARGYTYVRTPGIRGSRGRLDRDGEEASFDTVGVS